MNVVTTAIRTALALCITTAACYAVSPPMPGMTSGSGDNGMKHAMVSLTGTTLAVHLPATPASPLAMMSGFGMDYTPAKFDVLEDRYFNAQHGWLPDGFINLPTDRTLWMERIAATQPAGSSFHVYEAGMGSEMTAWTMNEIYAIDGARWQWDGVMQHDFYVGDMPGAYSMSFRVFVGDATGAEDLTYTPGTTTFTFTAVPEPAGMALAACGALGALQLRRR